jgi:hypothetical protein
MYPLRLFLLVCASGFVLVFGCLYSLFIQMSKLAVDGFVGLRRFLLCVVWFDWVGCCLSIVFLGVEVAGLVLVFGVFFLHSCYCERCYAQQLLRDCFCGCFFLCCLGCCLIVKGYQKLLKV